MNNFWFYWTMWGYFLIIAFFFKRGKFKNWLQIAILMTISLSPFQVNIIDVNLNLGYLVLTFSGCALMSGRASFERIHLGIASYIVMLLSILAQIYWLYDPAILLVLPKWTFIMFLGLFVLTLSSNIWRRLSIILIGMSQGEILQSVVFYPYDRTIGDVDYLVTVGFVIGVVVCFEFMTQAILLLRTVTENTTVKRLSK